MNKVVAQSVVAQSGASAARGTPVVDDASWPAVWSLMLGVCALITAEFLPAGLLTPLARDLGVSEALAGQAVTVTAIVSFFAALLTPTVTRRLDRRMVLLGFSAFLVASDLLVAAAPNLWAVLFARALLGIALGGFWSMATAVTIRLVPAATIPRAMSLVFSGISVATIVAVPLGSYLGGLYGWRVVFLLTAGFGGVTLALQSATLPRLTGQGTAQFGTLASVLRRPGIGLGMACIVLIYSGHFGLFTYLRPYLEGVGGMDSDQVSLILMIFGIANLVGTLLAGFLLERSLRLTLALMPMLLGAAGMLLAFAHGGFIFTAGLVALWGIAFGGIPVSWSTWVARAVPDETESGGGLLVAAVQIAITLGAAGGGVLDTLSGVTGVFAVAGVITLATSAVVYARFSAANLSRS
jgi:predicted MFS family arabinose efflux permease